LAGRGCGGGKHGAQHVGDGVAARCGSAFTGLSRTARGEPLNGLKSNAARLFAVAAVPLNAREDAFFIDATTAQLSGFNPVMKLLR
jgi:hypothetical protein